MDSAARWPHRRLAPSSSLLRLPSFIFPPSSSLLHLPSFIFPVSSSLLRLPSFVFPRLLKEILMQFPVRLKQGVEHDNPIGKLGARFPQFPFSRQAAARPMAPRHDRKIISRHLTTLLSFSFFLSGFLFCLIDLLVFFPRPIWKTELNNRNWIFYFPKIWGDCVWAEPWGL